VSEAAPDQTTMVPERWSDGFGVAEGGTPPRVEIRDGRPLGAAVVGHGSVELGADELFLALVKLDLGLRLRCVVCRGDKPDPLGLELGLAPLALPLLMLLLRPAHAVPPFASAIAR
jgi:hypothetical protein